ncbi:MAG: phosphopantothenoylcysteine decarboxylase [Verrucomicrobiota bacterium]
MRIYITLGPSYEPIDRVRRITNFSTGTLGTQLANAFLDEGHDLTCFRGEMSTCTEQIPDRYVTPFSTLQSLINIMRERAANSDHPSYIFHIAALTDFMIKEIRSESHLLNDPGKISSSAHELTLSLRPAPKLIVELRSWYPKSKIVGWKYEVDGTEEEAIRKGRAQIEFNHTNACVVNGPAFGKGCAFITSGQDVVTLPSNKELLKFLKEWAK